MRNVSPTVFHNHFHHEWNIGGQRRQNVILVDDFDIGIGLNICTGDRARLVGIDRQHSSVVTVVLDNQSFDVEDDFSNVFQDPGDGGKLVLCTPDLDLGDGTSFQNGRGELGEGCYRSSLQNRVQMVPP